MKKATEKQTQTGGTVGDDVFDNFDAVIQSTQSLDGRKDKKPEKKDSKYKLSITGTIILCIILIIGGLIWSAMANKDKAPTKNADGDLVFMENGQPVVRADLATLYDGKASGYGDMTVSRSSDANFSDLKLPYADGAIFINKELLREHIAYIGGAEFLIMVRVNPEEVSYIDKVKESLENWLDLSGYKPDSGDAYLAQFENYLVVGADTAKVTAIIDKLSSY